MSYRTAVDSSLRAKWTSGAARGRVLVAEDNDLNFEVLSDFLSAEGWSVTRARDGVEAVDRALADAPDIILMDVQMPEMTGLAVLRELAQKPPVVIFVTAFDAHAVSAFELHALDYLLKPFKPARFRASVQRARDQLARKNPADATPARLLALIESRPAASPAHVTRFAVRDRDRTRFVKVTDLDWIEASGNYVVMHAGKENFVLRETLAAVEAQVSPKEFFRLNRSALARQGLIQIFHDYLITHRLDELKTKFGGTLSSMSIPPSVGDGDIAPPKNAGTKTGGTLSPMSADDEDVIPPFERPVFGWRGVRHLC